MRVRRGARVRLTALLTVLAALTTLAGLPAQAVPTGTAERTALVLPVSWEAGNGSPAAPMDQTLLRVTAQIGAADKHWYQAVSHGQFPGWHARGVGPLTIPAPQMDADGTCAGTFEYDLVAKANAAARAQHIDPADYDTVVYYFSRVIRCPWSGLSDGKLVWLNGTLSTGTTVQELGHTLQLGHGLGLRCQDAAGATVTLSGTCTPIAYGDPFNAMGSGDGSFSAIQQNDLGWLTGRLVDVPVAGGTFTIEPLESDAVAPQVLRLGDSGGTLWIEYRQPIGVDSGLSAASAGVLIRRQLPDLGTKSLLLDLNPATSSDFGDARLPVGTPWTNPFSGATITVTSATAAGATITVKVARAAVPNLVGMTTAQARTALNSRGFTSMASSSYLDTTCTYLGVIGRQSPAAGTSAPLAATVRVYVGAMPHGTFECP
jgi:hypothetical protein